MQLAINVQIPINFGGLGGECIYIDTEGSFVPHRVAEMAEAMSQDLSHRALRRSTSLAPPGVAVGGGATSNTTTDGDLMMKTAQIMTMRKFLSGIHYYRTHDSHELVATINKLAATLHTMPHVRLVIIDSIAFPFRATSQGQGQGQDLQSKNRLLSGLAQTLYSCAQSYKVAVVVTNHMVSSYGGGRREEEQQEEGGECQISLASLVVA